MSDQSKYFFQIDRQSWLKPDFVASSVADIDVETLKDSGIACLILDIDDTLVKHGGKKVDTLIISHLKLIRKSGIKLVIGSNTRRDISSIATSIGAITVSKKWWHYKPMGRFFYHLLASINLPPDKIVMVGDRIINDVIGANRVGIRTILVPPIKRKLGWVSRRYWVKIKQDISLADSNPFKK